MIDGNEGWYQPCESCCIKIKRISSVLTSLPHPRQKANVSDAMAAENLSAKFETLLADSSFGRKEKRTFIVKTVFSSVRMLHNPEVRLAVVI